MPIYEYQCLSCGNKLEQLQNLSDPPLTVCPTCSGELKKLISSPAFQFKGTGWYVTDYAGKKGSGGGEGGGSSSSEKSEKAEKSEKSEKSEGSSGGSGGDKPAESKPKESAPAAKPSSDS
jgi:putative FmdB family regulatory protein